MCMWKIISAECPPNWWLGEGVSTGTQTQAGVIFFQTHVRR